MNQEDQKEILYTAIDALVNVSDNLKICQSEISALL